MAKLAKMAQERKKELQGSMEPLAEAFAQLAKEVPEISEETNRLLGQWSWFLSYDLTIPNLSYLLGLARKGDRKQVDEQMSSFVRSNPTTFENRLLASHPEGAKIIAYAFLAHEHGIYGASVPALLILTDGICEEFLESGFFSKKKTGTPKTAEVLDVVGNETTKQLFFSVLRMPLPIRTSHQGEPDGWDREIDRDQLYRNGILHGSVSDYATEKHSLKAVSLLDYVSSACDLFSGLYPKGMPIDWEDYE